MLDNSKENHVELMNQDSLINGTFLLDNTQSLEKFKEIEKLCESQADIDKSKSRLLGSQDEIMDLTQMTYAEDAQNLTNLSKS